MKEVKICYSRRDNIGDAINPYILEEVYGVKPVYADEYHCNLSGIGSGLRRYFYDPTERDIIRNIGKEVKKRIYREPLILWSSGFIRTPSGFERPARQNIVLSSVRGKKTLEYVKTYFDDSELDCVTGDAGILASELVDSKPAKKYSLGIIPHDNERGEIAYTQLGERIRNSIIIDVRGDVKERLRLISECECVVSSSLHGLIIADGFHIPNRRVQITDKLDGDGFKFDDYYSNYSNSVAKPFGKEDLFGLTLYDVIDNYRVSISEVEKSKKQLYESLKGLL